MPRIFDNMEQKLLPALRDTLNLSYRADFCVGYFNLRGWRQMDDQIEAWTGGDNSRCRLLVGMQPRPREELQAAFGFGRQRGMDNKTMLKLKKKLAEEFRQQLTIGAPTSADEAGLQRLARQIKAGKVVVKLFLRHPLHAKLYLLFRDDAITPRVAYMGSSNLTFSGLLGQGELNIDVVARDSSRKLANWFEERWNDRWCLDISRELVQIIEESWASSKLMPPYYIYLKMAYHLSSEARAGLTEFSIPRDLDHILFDFQKAAVKIAARHLNQRGGVLIGDVVGLGKSLMATTLSKIFEEDYNFETLIICPKNLVKMWEWYRDEYHLRAKVLSVSRVIKELPELRRFRLLLIDESHNLRNREGKRYRAIREYIQKNDSRCILLSATPYNKSYLDLSNQLRLFVPENADLGLRPEQLLREIGVLEFLHRYQVSLRSLAAFEKSQYADDWRELMRLFMVRRTRSFIRDNYAQTDSQTGSKFLAFADGRRAYFPTRHPKTVRFAIDENDPNDQYGQLYAAEVVELINELRLPRYGLGNYQNKRVRANAQEQKALKNLSRGGRRLVGFSRTNLFKRLESSGYVFLLSVERHLLRNYVFIHALKNKLPLPIGSQDAQLLDTRFSDRDDDEDARGSAKQGEGQEAEASQKEQLRPARKNQKSYLAQAAAIYELYATRYEKRFGWIDSRFFKKTLIKELRSDSRHLLKLLQTFGEWDVSQDGKLDALVELLTVTHPAEKVLIFSQFADTVNYLSEQLQARGLSQLAGVTGNSVDPTAMAWRFSPVSNGKREQVSPAEELRVLIATDVLSEGQNLQDAHIVVNYDLPWAIIRLIQRAGRVDRIGQEASDILCYTFWPADGVEQLIRLRERLRQRLRENAEVVGTDEAFFEDDKNEATLYDLYSEKAGVLDDESDSEIDLVSYAYQIWKNATDANPKLKTIIPKLPSVVYATKSHAERQPLGPPGVLVYFKTTAGNSALAWLDQKGNSVTESQFTILKAAACAFETEALPRQDNHHDLVQKAVKHITRGARYVEGGQLGRPSSARFKSYERLKTYALELQKTLFAHEVPPLFKALDAIYRYPLQERAKDSLNRQLRSHISVSDLAELVVSLYEEGHLSLIQKEKERHEAQIVCSLGLL
jgi:superfamily II DNA or RNA helicase